MNDLDTRAAAGFEGSAIVRGMERGAAALRTAARESRLNGAVAKWRHAVRPHSGEVLITAAITHLILMMATRPPSWHFAILPSIFLAAGIVLRTVSNRN